MNRSERSTAVLYVDDGHPESRDYDSNYVGVDAKEPRSWLRVLLGLRRERETPKAHAGGMQLDAGLSPRQQPA
jgi:hypothetical protein